VLYHIPSSICTDLLYRSLSTNAFALLYRICQWGLHSLSNLQLPYSSYSRHSSQLHCIYLPPINLKIYLSAHHLSFWLPPWSIERLNLVDRFWLLNAFDNLRWALSTHRTYLMRALYCPPLCNRSWGRHTHIGFWNLVCTWNIFHMLLGRFLSWSEWAWRNIHRWGHRP